MSTDRIFQFSSFDNKEQEERLKLIITRLGASYDESKFYSPLATHLIVGDKIECTEKVLCYISAGKHILRKSYLHDCYFNRKFLDEQDYHVSKRDATSKLAKVSLKWFHKINESIENAPFKKWKVGCLVKDEESLNALIRIIKAGYGEAACIRNKPLDSINELSLIIFDNKHKQLAVKYSLELSIPCYPYQCLPDYLIQCEINDQPIISYSYYEHVERKIPPFSPPKSKKPKQVDFFLNDVSMSSATKQNENTLTYLDSDLINDDGFMINCSYNMLFLSSYQKYVDSGSIDNCLESQFLTLWKNNAFNEALNLIVLLEYDEVPSVNTLKLLFEFILDKSTKDKHCFSYDFNNEANFNSIYNSIYSYILNLILNHPPINDLVIGYYKKCFDKLIINYRLDNGAAFARGLIDTLYLISVHDYFIIKSSNAKDSIDKMYYLSLNFANEAAFKKLFKFVLGEDNLTMQSYHKLQQIVCFTNKYCYKLKLFTKMEQCLSKQASGQNYKKIFSNLIL